jgi:hypothetical protein
VVSSLQGDIASSSDVTCWLSGRQFCSDQSKSTKFNYFPKLSKEWIKCSSTSSSLALHCLTSASWTSYCMVSNGAPKQSNIAS